MELRLYGIIIAYFILGGLIMARVNRGKEPAFRRQNWIKYVVYLILINLLFLTIIFRPALFPLWCGLIITLGAVEILRLGLRSGHHRTGLFSLLIFIPAAFFFFRFSQMPREYPFYALFLTTVFDAFSQLGGQLFGKRKLVPAISPNKTVEGLLSGILVTLLTAGFIHGLLAISVGQSVLLGIGLAAFAFLGDLAASYCKRQFKVKDFSNLIPGHGGVLDRFDSLLISGAFLWGIVQITGL